MNWFTSDWHLGHKNIITYENRPFNDVEEQTNVLFSNYEDLIQEQDTVYFLGDIIFDNRTYIKVKDRIANLKGTKILIRGNHDISIKKYKDAGFQEVYKTHNFENITLVHDPVLSITDKHKWFVCGHVHSMFRVLNNAINVSVELWDYKPVNLPIIESIMSNNYLKNLEGFLKCLI